MSKITITNDTEPDIPSSGRLSIWSDSSTKSLKSKDDAGTILSYGDDKKVMVSGNDTTHGYLEDKVAAGTGIALATLNEGGNEQLQITNTSLAELNPTGLIFETSGVVTVNGSDPSLFDITETDYFIQGVSYTFAADTAIDPQFGVGENSSFVGLDSSGLTYKSTKWTTSELQTIIPIVRFNTASGITGPGSNIELIRDDRYLIDQTGWRDRNWTEKALGALYYQGGLISESGTPLQLSQSAGTLFDAQRKEQTLGSIANIDAVKVFHTSGVPDTSDASPLVVDVNLYDDGNNLVSIPSNKFVCHSLLKSPKGSPQEGGFFFIYSDTLFNNQTEAEQCSIDWSIFTDQATSGLVSVARIIVKQGASSIASIFDERPFAAGGGGASVSTVTPTMQQVYESSAIPQIALNNTQGGLDVRDSASPLGTDLLAIKDSAGTTTHFGVAAGGVDIELAGDNNFFVDASSNPRTVTVGAIRSNHKAGVNGTRNTFINVDSNGYDNTRGGQINHALDDSTASITPTNLLLTAEVDNTENAHVHMISCSKTGVVGSGTVLDALDVGLGINPLAQSSGAISSADKAWTFDGVYTDVTTNFGTAVSNSQIFVGDNDYIYISKTSGTFNLIEVILAIIASEDITAIFQYSQGASSWNTISVLDGTSGFTSSGIIDLGTVPGDWASDTVNGVAGYYIRIQRTKDTVATPPTESQIRISTPTEFFWNSDADVYMNTIQTESTANIGDPGFETSGVNINGTVKEAELRVNDFGAVSPIMLALHRHSTTEEASIMCVRSKSDTASHANVTNDDVIMSIAGAGWTGSHYDENARIEFSMDSTGTVSSTSSPGKISLKTTPDASNTPIERMSIDNVGDVTMEKSLIIKGQAYSETNTLSDAATVATDCSLGNVHTVTLAGNRTLGAPTNLKNGSTYIWIVKQDATGSRTLAYNAVFKFPGGIDPVLTTTINAVDILTGVSDGTNVYLTMQPDFK